MPHDPAARLDALEVRIAHQDATIEDLNAVVMAQSRKIDVLVREVKGFADRLQEMAMRDPREPERPPHY